MRRFIPALAVFTCSLWLLSAPTVLASSHAWRVESPDHGQTYAFGSEKRRAWMETGPDRHLTLFMELTNDPYVDIDNPRRWDTFTFSFPSIRLGKDGRTFYYHDGEGNTVPVAQRRPGFLGITEIKLLPNASLNVSKVHGYLSLELFVEDPRVTGSLTRNGVVLVHQPHRV